MLTYLERNLKIILDQNDCGIKALNCCKTPRCFRLGTTRTFVAVLVLLAIVQGVAEKFVAISAHQAALEHDFHPDVVGKIIFQLTIAPNNSDNIFST